MTEPRTIKVLYRDKAWKIYDGAQVVGSYSARAVAARRALQKAQTAVMRGEKIIVILHTRDDRVERTRTYPTVRKPRSPRTQRDEPSGGLDV